MLVFTQEDYLPDKTRPLPRGEVMLACSCTPGVCEDGCTQCGWEECTVLKHEGGENYTVEMAADGEKVTGLPRRYLHALMPTENTVSYCMETKLLSVKLCVAHVDLTCHLKAGAEPRKPDNPGLDYDPVTRKWVDREQADIWTLARLHQKYSL